MLKMMSKVLSLYAVVFVCILFEAITGLTVSRSDVISEMNSRYELLQLNIQDYSLATLGDSFTGLDYLVGGVRRASIGILSADGSRVVFKGIEQKDGGLVAQFTILPASNAELDQFSAGWSDAIIKKDPALSNIFKNINFDYPPTILTGVTTTTTKSTTSTTPERAPVAEDEASSNTGVVVGAVFGSLLAVGAIGGGGYYYKKKSDEKNAQPKVGERSPGADGFTPGGLANIGIHGEATPNPNNFH